MLLVHDLERPNHEIKKEHLDQIQAVNSSAEIVLLSSTQLDEINRHMEDAEIMAGMLGSIPEISDVKQLKYIHVFSAGVDRVLTPEIANSDVLLGNCSGIHAIPIAEHVLGFILLFTRRFYDTFDNQQKKIWEKNNNVTELRDKTVLIVGLGNIGMEAARLLSCMGARIMAVDRPEKSKPDFVEALYTFDQWVEALSQPDFVVVAVPLTADTRYLFGMEKFRVMKETAVFINISRGQVVNEHDLIDALQQQVIAGAALDVTEEEPLPQESPLWSMPNVIITPHQSGISEKYMDRAVNVFCSNLKAYILRKTLPNLVDKEKGY